MVSCPLCGKGFEYRRGLHGHYRFVHGLEYSSGKPAKNTVLMEAIREKVEKSRKGLELIEKIKNGEFELISRSEKKELEARVRETEKDKKLKKALERFGGK